MFSFRFRFRVRFRGPAFYWFRLYDCCVSGMVLLLLEGKTEISKLDNRESEL